MIMPAVTHALLALCCSRQPILYYMAGGWALCLVFGSWTMLRLPVLCGVCVLLCIEFQLYWVVGQPRPVGPCG